MYKFLTKYGQLTAFGVGLLIVVVYLVVAYTGLDSFNMLVEEKRSTTSIFNIGLVGAIILIVVCFIAAVFFGIYHLIMQPKGALKFLVGFLFLAIVFVIAFFMAKPETASSMVNLLEKHEVSENTSKFISGSLTTMLVLGAVAILAFVYAEVRNLFK